MDYKQKYEDALERAKQAIDNIPDESLAKWLQSIFPELKESEDEKIRKEILNVIHQLDDNTTICGRNYDFQKWITWLEKQGEQKVDKCKDCNNVKGCIICTDGDQYAHITEQKPIDKTEPKFKVGDWIIFNGITLYVKEVVKGYYRTTSIGGIPISYGWDIDSVARLWTIQDAKDGDVLTTHISPEGDWIGMYKQSTDDTFSTYCFLNAIGEFVVNPNRCKNHGTHGLHPATKEQRDLLFTKMKEAGYEWDAEKKELKKIDARKNLTLDGDLMQADCKVVEQSAWSEEDDKHLLGCINYFSGITESSPYYNDFLWLESIKERIKGE